LRSSHRSERRSLPDRLGTSGGLIREKRAPQRRRGRQMSVVRVAVSARGLQGLVTQDLLQYVQRDAGVR
jgi:hypothetical protein